MIWFQCQGSLPALKLCKSFEKYCLTWIIKYNGNKKVLRDENWRDKLN